MRVPPSLNVDLHAVTFLVSSNQGLVRLQAGITGYLREISDEENMRYGKYEIWEI